MLCSGKVWVGRVSENFPAILLMGPTASGKTALAVELVRRFPLEIISVDSALVYRGMDIGTAKPGSEILQVAPHRLIDILDPAESYSAARFRTDALREMVAIRQRGRIPLLVGGTLLYFKALEQGLSLLPSADAKVRRQIEGDALTQGWRALHTELAQVDPEAAGRIHPNDSQRLQRAIEVYRVSGTPMSHWLARQASQKLPFRFLRLGLMPGDRRLLYQRIARRFEKMLEQGLINEVEGLYQREDLDVDRPSMRAVGYRQVWHYLDGEYDLIALRKLAITATRQLAKRQMTWMRGDDQLEAFVPDNAGNPMVLDRVASFLRQF